MHALIHTTNELNNTNKKPNRIKAPTPSLRRISPIELKKPQTKPRAAKQKNTRRGCFLRNGAPEEIRTPDLLIRSQALYPAELRVLAKWPDHRRKSKRLQEELLLWKTLKSYKGFA